MTYHSHGYRLLVPRSPGSTAATMQADPRITTDWVMPARFRAVLHLGECASRIGPAISIQPALVLPGFQARITFRDRPHRDDVPYQETSAVVPLVLPGERLERPALSLRGAPGRSRFALRLLDGGLRPLVPSQEIECLAGSRLLEVPILLEVSAVVRLSAHPATGSTGPRLHVNGKLVFHQGITAHIGPPSGVEESARDLAVPERMLVSPGTMFFFYERTVESGLPGDPWVSLRFLDERSAPIGEEQPVGLFHAA